MHRLSLALLALVAAVSNVAITQGASAADLVKAPAYRAPTMAPIYNWTGPYVGLNLGGSWGNQDNSLVSAGGANLLSNSDHLNGVIGGGQIGYNWQVNQWVLGLEADFQGSGQNADGSFLTAAPGGLTQIPIGTPIALVFGTQISMPATGSFPTSIAYSDKLDWFGTVRGRLGYAFERWLPYVTGGWAYGNGEINGTATVGGVATSFSGSQDYSGWTVGGGLEWAFANNWSAKAEYLYIDFSDGPNGSSKRLTDNIVRAGVNYKFW